MVTRKEVGAYGERVVGHRLEALGMRIIDRNARTPSGEIDIVASDGGDTVFVEVRTRRAVAGVAAESVGEAKLRRMWRCAMEYCELHEVDPEYVRIDLVAVDVDPESGETELVHFPALEIPDEE